jgi:hypothetical protein
MVRSPGNPAAEGPPVAPPRAASFPTLPGMLSGLRLGSPSSAPPPVKFKRPDTVALQRGGLFVKEHASLSDVLPFLRSSDPDARLVAITGRDGFTRGDRLFWLKPNEDPLGKTERKAKDLLLRLIGNIPVPELPSRLFYENSDPSQRDLWSPVYNLHHAIGKCAGEINDAPRLDGTTVRTIAERMHRVATLSMPAPSRDPDMAPPRPPADCMAHCLDMLDQARAALPPTSVHRRRNLDAAIASTQKQWLGHALDVDYTREYFKAMAKWGTETGFPQVADLANSLHAETVRYAQQGRSLAAENDNLMQRAWESALVRALIAAPPPATLAAAHQVGRHLAARLRHIEDEDRESAKKVVASLHRGVTGNPRPWIHTVTALEAFANADDNKKKRRLLEYLEREPLTGEECLSIYYVTVKMSKALKTHARKYTPWADTKEDKKEYAIRDDARRLIKGRSQLGPGSGILLAHQPPMQDDPYAGYFGQRPALHNHPDLANPSQMIEHALAHGKPYVSGPSGSSAFILRAVEHMISKEKGQFSRRQAMLGALMFLVFDGGHSLHEVMWALNLSKPRIDTNLSGASSAPSDYVGDYEAFFNAFQDSSQPYLANAKQQAFTSMIAHRRELLGDAAGS